MVYMFVFMSKAQTDVDGDNLMTNEPEVSSEENVTQEVNYASTHNKQALFQAFKRLQQMVLIEDIPAITVTSLTNHMNKVQTKEHLISVMRRMNLLMNVKFRTGKKIRVQPTSIARRKIRKSKRTTRIPSGRPIKESRGQKRKRNIALSISENRPNAKSH